MVGRLLERYALSMNEVDLRDAACLLARVPAGGKRRRPVDTCVPAIARFCCCKVWLEREDDGDAHYVFFGFETDVALAGYLFTVAAAAMQTELLRFRADRSSLTGTMHRTASTNFQMGMAQRIAERLEQTQAAREEAIATQRPVGTALVLARQHTVEDAFRERKVRLRAQRGVAFRADGAYQAGRAAGERVNINRPVHAAERGRLV